eukprot:1836001-Rhodomonas_salina.3
MGKAMSTSSMRKHLQHVHRSQFEALLAEEVARGHTGKRASTSAGAAVSEPDKSQPAINKVLKPLAPLEAETWQDLVVELIVRRNLPFDFVEDEVFRRLCQVLAKRCAEMSVNDLKT